MYYRLSGLLAATSLFASAKLQMPTAPLGGAINEKQKNEVPEPKLAHLLHALFGLDHYPNYLQRWRDEEVDELEAALESSLREVRRQRALQRDRTQACAAYQPQLDVSRTALIAALDPPLADALGLTGTGSEAINVGKLYDLMIEEHEGIFSLRVFQPSFCESVLVEARRFYEWAVDKPCLSVSDRPLDLQLMGLGAISDLLLQEVMSPISDLLFKNEAMGPLDWRHGFVVGYAVDKGPGITRTSLVSHTDDSEVTLNLSLGRSFTGGMLRFGGLRGQPDETRVVMTYQHQPGRAVLHAGRQLHEVEGVTSGERFALICWARSRAGLRARVCPCCFMNRRVGADGSQGADCICGPAWN